MDKIESYTTVEREELMGLPEPGELWVVRYKGKARSVIFHCPCGSGEAFRLPVTDATAGEVKAISTWLYSAGPTLFPSVRQLGGCKCHYNITDGKVIWHPDSGR